MDFHKECEEYSPDFIKQNIDTIVYDLTNGNFTLFENARKLKVTTVNKILLIKEIEAFRQWYANKISQPDTE